MTIDSLKTLFEQFHNIKKAAGGKISIENLDEMIAKLANLMKTNVQTQGNVEIYNDIIGLKEKLTKLKSILTLMSGTDQITDVIQSSKEIIKYTEEATTVILTEVEKLENLDFQTNDSETIKKEIAKVSIKIYGACNFQDIIGQVLRNQMKILEKLDQQLKILATTMPTSPEKLEEKTGVNKTIPNKEEDIFLKGPQLSTPPDQSAIDDLFNNA